MTILEELKNMSKEERVEEAKNWSTSHYTFRQLYKLYVTGENYEDEKDLVIALYRNPFIPEDLRDKLTKLAERPARYPISSFSYDDQDATGPFILSNYSSGKEVAYNFNSYHKEFATRLSVAQSDLAPRSTLKKLYQLYGEDEECWKDKKIRHALAWNWNTPQHVLDDVYEVYQLYCYDKEDDLELLMALVQNPRTSAIVLDSIFENYISQRPKKFSAFFGELAKNPKTTAKTLAKLAKLVQSLQESPWGDISDAVDESEHPWYENGADVLFSIYEHPRASKSLRQSIANFIGE